MEYIENGIRTLNDFLWGWPLIGLLFGTHLFLTIRTGVIQRFVFRGIRWSLKKEEGGVGEGIHLRYGKYYRCGNGHRLGRTGSRLLVLADGNFRDGDDLQ